MPRILIFTHTTLHRHHLSIYTAYINLQNFRAQQLDSVTHLAVQSAVLESLGCRFDSCTHFKWTSQAGNFEYFRATASRSLAHWLGTWRQHCNCKSDFWIDTYSLTTRLHSQMTTEVGDLHSYTNDCCT